MKVRMERRGEKIWCGDRGSDEKVERKKMEMWREAIRGLRVVLGWLPGCVCALRYTLSSSCELQFP